MAVFATLPSAWADPVDLTKAKEIAAAYMSDGQTPELVETSVSKRTATNNDNAPLYIFNRGNDEGFVIISGDDCLPLVLGYTEEGDFNADELPPALLSWIEGYAELIEDAQAQGATARVSKRATSTKATISPLCSSSWHQSSPYNAMCPYLSDGSGQAITGCVATAASQVLYYWRYDLPERTSYTTPTYSYGDAPVTESVEEGTPFQWELMQDSHSSSTPDDMNTAVARLNFVVGSCTWLTYGSSTSGQISNLVYTFSAQFSLSSLCEYKTSYTQTQWENLIYADLEKGWPIVYSGVSSSSGGHAVVIDGYRASDDLFHFNFGWGGSGNGYYTVDDETGMNGFNESQGMTYNIHPTTSPITAKILTDELYSRMENTIEVEVTNNSSHDYSGIYLFASRNEGTPDNIDDANVEDTETSIASGETAVISFPYTPSSTRTLYIYVTDNTADVIAQTTITPSDQAPALTLNAFKVNEGAEATDGDTLYYNVYSDNVSATASISNSDDATPGNPTLTCILYKYDEEGDSLTEVSSEKNSDYNFGLGETYDVTFDFGALDTDVLYALNLSSSYKCASDTLYLYTEAADTLVYFKVHAADLTMTATDDNGAVVTGHWNSTVFEELADSIGALYYDLTAVEGIDAIPQLDNPNTLFYLSANTDTNVEGTNIIVNGTCAELSLTYGYDFHPADDFTATSVTFDPQTTSSDWKCIVLPFACDVPDGSRARRIVTITNKLISESDEVNTTLTSCTPYLYKTAWPGDDRITAENVTVSINGTADCAEQLVGTFVNLTATSDQRILSSTSFSESTGSAISAFSGYLDYTTDVSISIYSYSDNDDATDELGELIDEAAQMAEDYADRLSEEDLETFLEQIEAAAVCYTQVADEDETDAMAETLEAAINECTRNLIVTDDPTDVTDVYLTNASFEKGRSTGWTITRVSGQSSKVIDVASELEDYMVDADGTYVFYSYSSSDAGSVTISQEATGMKEGYYQVKAWLASDDGESVTLFAGDSTAIMTGDDLGERYMRETTIDSIYVEEDGTLEIGVQGNNDWYKADNFKLYYLGSESIVTAIEDVKTDISDESLSVTGGIGCIYINAPQDTPTDISIYSADGRLMRQVSVSGNKQIGGLAKGLYIVNHLKVIVR